LFGLKDPLHSHKQVFGVHILPIKAVMIVLFLCDILGDWFGG
jgi:hypothetical protein